MLVIVGAVAVQQPRRPRSRRGGRGGRSRRAGGASPLAGRRRLGGGELMHLVLRCVCAIPLSEERAAVCLLSGGAFLPEPRWLLDDPLVC